MTMHNALTSNDIELLFAAAEGDGRVQVVQKTVVEIETDGQKIAGVDREGLQRLVACGYLEGGPDVYQVTRAGREYADSMK
jgi:hypothetical protein